MILVQSFATLLAIVVIFNISVVQASPVPKPISKTLSNQTTDARNNSLRGGQKRIFDIILEANSKASSNIVGKLEGAESLFQGDIVMTDDIREALRTSGADSMTLPPSGTSSCKRAVSSVAHYKWPKVNGVVEVPYVIEPSSVPDQSVIKQAISHWTQKVPCITFVPRTTQNDYISFFAGQGCYSWIGRTGGKQRISIGSGCAYMGVIAHEIGHALGFDFDQTNGLSDKDIEQARLLYCPGTNACSSLYADSNGSCAGWAALGHCDNPTYKAFMDTNCKKSCVCRVCEDKHVNCAAYVAGGYCTNQQYKAFMETYCRKGCGLCT